MKRLHDLLVLLHPPRLPADVTVTTRNVTVTAPDHEFTVRAVETA